MTRTRIWSIGFLGAGLFTGTWAVGIAQQPGTPTATYYPSKMSPAPAGLVAPAKVTPGATQPPVWQMSPAGSTQAMSPPAVKNEVPVSQPIINAGGPVATPSQPIQLVNDQFPIAPPPVVTTPAVSLPSPVAPPTTLSSPTIPSAPPATIPTPSIPTATPPTPAPLAPPTVVIETTPTNPEPKPLTLGGTNSTMPGGVTPPTVTSGPVPTGMLATKHATGVSVETVAPESVSVGQDCTYELIVKNDGSAAVWNVRVEDQIPAGTKYLSSEPQGEMSNGRLSWNLGTVEAGGAKRIKVIVRPADEGEIRNRTVVTFAAATEAKMKVTRPKVAVAVTAPDTVKAGEEAAFTIRLTNSGSGPATNLVMQARLSDGFHHAAGSVLELKLPALPAGQTKTIPLKAIATKSGPQSCTITAIADGTTTEPSKSSVTIVEPKLTARVVGPAKCLVKAEPVYTLEFTNPGTAATDPLTVTATIPQGFDYMQASDGGLLMPSGREVQWKLTGLPASQGKAVSMKLKSVAPSDATVKVHVGAMTQDSVSTGTVATVAAAQRTLEAKADLAVKAEGVAALRFEVIDIEDPVEVGKEAVYEIRVTNQGTGPCTNVQIVGFPAEGTTPVTSNGPTTVRVQAGQMIFDPIAKLDVKGEAIYRVKVKGNTAGDQKFRVQVACDQIRTPISKEENTRFVKE